MRAHSLAAWANRKRPVGYTPVGISPSVVPEAVIDSSQVFVGSRSMRVQFGRPVESAVYSLNKEETCHFSRNNGDQSNRSMANGSVSSRITAMVIRSTNRQVAEDSESSRQ